MLVDLMQLFNTVQPIQNCYSMYVDIEKVALASSYNPIPMSGLSKNRTYLTHSTYHNTIKVQFEDAIRE